MNTSPESEPERPVVVGTRPDALASDLPPWLARLDQVRVALRDDALEWCRDRSWEVRVPVLILFAYILFRHLTQIEYGHFLFNGINLGVHEAGHILFGPLGEFMMLAGGTILQCLVPVIAAGAFWKSQRDYFGVAFCFGWLATNCFNCAIYAADARGALNLPLVSPWGQGFGADGAGDWTRMLTKVNLLHWDTTISSAWKLAGTASMALCFLLGGWLLWQMHRARNAPPPPREEPDAFFA